MTAHGGLKLEIFQNFGEIVCVPNPGIRGTELLSAERAFQKCENLCMIPIFSSLDMVDILGIQLGGHPPR